MEEASTKNPPAREGVADGAPGWFQFHSIELPNGEIIPGFQSLDRLKRRIAQFPLPENLKGKTVLDIGASDGWFSFEMERRGCRVTAVDRAKQPGFLLAKERLGSRVDYRAMNVYDLSPGNVGQFDIVLFLGVLYHLKHPILGLERVCALTKDMALIESHVSLDSGDSSADAKPSMEFYETDELRGQHDNWCGPNPACLLSFCRTAGFGRVQLLSIIEDRAHVVCYRHWEPPPASPAYPEPKVDHAVEVLSETRYLSSHNDDHVSIFFNTPERDLTHSNVFPEVGGYAIQPLYVGRNGDAGWQANCKVPPGLAPGWHDVRVRTANSAFSDPVQIAVDLERQPPSVEHLQIEIVADGTTWSRNQVALSSESYVSVWLSGLPQNAEREDVKVRIGETGLPVSFLSSPDRRGFRQANARLPWDFPAGDYPLVVVCAGAVSAPADLKVIQDERWAAS